MKSIHLSALAGLLVLISCNQTVETPRHSDEALALMNTLSSAAEQGKVLFGHQDALMYGHAWHLTSEETQYAQSDVYEVCGDYAAILGYDLGEIELGGENNIDGNSFRQMREAAIKNHERGGLLTFSWHPRNPLTGGDAWDVSSDKVVESILPEGENHEKFMGWLEIVADYLSSYDMPMIFRPWHENSGSWFWWGKGICTPEQYKALWVMTYDYLVKERGLNNLVWAYCPSASDYMTTYPGDDYVDIMGTDIYVYNPDGFIDQVQHDLEIISSLAKSHRKILALTETGWESTPDPKFWTEKLLAGLEGYPVAYALAWRNASDKPTHYFGPWAGAADEDDFKEFYQNEKTLFLNDIK